MKVLLTGASGLAGAAFAEVAARRGHHVVGIVHASNRAIPGVADLHKVDLRNRDRVMSFVLEQFPDVIVNAAAVTENPACEADPASARALNVDLPRQLGQLARHLMQRVVHLSTDLVFDGTAAPYAPGAPVAPRSLYGRLKAEGEVALLEAATEEFGVVVRAPLLTGNSPAGTRSVHERLFAAWARGERVRLFKDEFRTPVGATNLAEALVEICERQDVTGVQHWCGADRLSRAAMGRRVAEHFRIPPELVEEVRAADDPRFADRPRDVSLDRGSLRVLRTVPEDFETQLDVMVVPRPFREWFHALPPLAV